MARIVVVLGREPDVDMNAVVHDAWQSHSELVILNLGYPLTDTQHTAIDVAMEAAGRGVLGLEARISYTVSEAIAKIEDEDTVILAVNPREMKKLQRAVEGRVTLRPAR